MTNVMREAEADAAAVLESFQIIEPPVDPIAIASDLGIEVWSSVLDSDVAGLLVGRGRGATEIYLNRADHKHRQRFTCAHELGHFYQRKLGAVEGDFDFVDYRSDLASAGTDPGERYANAFAAALLMPRAFLESQPDLSVGVLARSCEVSVQAMTYRLENLGLPVRGRRSE